MAGGSPLLDAMRSVARARDRLASMPSFSLEEEVRRLGALRAYVAALQHLRVMADGTHARAQKFSEELASEIRAEEVRGSR